MAGRPNKVGLDYFELDCLLDDNVKLIQAEFGLKGFAIIVKLYQKIYSTCGYYCEWNDDILLLFLVENGLPSDSKNLINEIVTACVRRNIFSKKLFDKFNILTSSGVQKRYLNATSKREKVEVKKEYLLLSVGKNTNNVIINSINDNRNRINDVDNSQSKEEESKEDNDSCPPNAGRESAGDMEEKLKSDFEKIYAIYPKKAGRTVAFANYKLWLTGKQIGKRKYKLTNKQMYLAVKKYVDQQYDAGKEDFQFWKNFDTLMGRQLLDFVDDGSGG